MSTRRRNVNWRINSRRFGHKRMVVGFKLFQTFRADWRFSWSSMS